MGSLTGAGELRDLDDCHLLADQVLIEVLLEAGHVRILTYKLIYKMGVG